MFSSTSNPYYARYNIRVFHECCLDYDSPEPKDSALLKNWPLAVIILQCVRYNKIQSRHNLNWVGGNIRRPWFKSQNNLYQKSENSRNFVRRNCIRKGKKKRRKNQQLSYSYILLQQHYSSLLSWWNKKLKAWHWL